MPPPLKRWREPGEDAPAGPYLAQPLQISFPADRSEIETADFEGQPMVLKAEGGDMPLTWLVNGTPIASDPHSRDVEWTPSGSGFAKLTVIDANGRTDRAAIRVR